MGQMCETEMQKRGKSFVTLVLQSQHTVVILAACCLRIATEYHSSLKHASRLVFSNDESKSDISKVADLKM